VEVEVDTETGMVRVPRMVMAVDCGTAINPMTASGQIEGGQLQALGMAISEGMEYDTEGNVLQKRFGDYRIYEADEAPEITAILVPTFEPSGPYGAKAVAEIPMDGVGPAVSNAIFAAIGVRLRELPVLPEKVWKGIQEK
jgi:putative selenate reductase molybdopterin-binding subunit